MNETLIYLSFFLTLVITFFSAYFASLKNKDAENLWIFTVIVFIINSIVGCMHLAFPSNYYATVMDLMLEYNVILAVLGYFWYKSRQVWSLLAGGVFVMQVVFSWLMLAYGVSEDAFKIMVYVFHQLEMVVIAMTAIYYILQSTFDPHKKAVQR